MCGQNQDCSGIINIGGETVRFGELGFWGVYLRRNSSSACPKHQLHTRAGWGKAGSNGWSVWCIWSAEWWEGFELWNGWWSSSGVSLFPGCEAARASVGWSYHMVNILLINPHPPEILTTKSPFVHFKDGKTGSWGGTVTCSRWDPSLVLSGFKS